MDLFIDAHQYGRIAKAQSDATNAKNKAESFDRRLTNTERRLDKLSLACQALWELLKVRTDLTIEDVYNKMEEIDLRDGHKDGKISGTVLKCSSCGRTINTLHSVCIYCGTENPTEYVVL